MMTEQTAPADTAEKSLREELQANFAAATAVDGTVVDDGGAVDQGAVDTSLTAGEQRTRDAHGRFAGKQAAEDAKVVDRTGQAAPGAGASGAAAAAGQGAGQGAGDQQQAQAAAAAAAAAIAAPGNLKPELRAAWDAARPELRKWISDREAEVHKGFTRMDEERQFAKTMRETIAPYHAMIQAEGGEPVSAVRALLNTAYILRAGSPLQKVQALQSIATQYGITPEHVQQAQAQQGQQQRLDPAVAAMQRELQQLKSDREREVADRQQQAQIQFQTEIQAFAASPGHEHFEQVKPHMAALLSNNLAKDMQDAYDQAVWARPDLRQTVLAAQQQTAQQAQATQAQARAAAAKRAAGSVAGSPGTSIPVAAPDRSLREELRANFRAAQH